MIEEHRKILKLLTEATGRIDTNELARKIGITSKQLIEQVQKMTKIGLLKRVNGGYAITKKARNALKATEQVPVEKRFNFYNGLDQPAGESAASAKEFYDLVLKVDPASIEFHLYRNDFENWFRSTIDDPEFANELSNIKKANLKGEDLRRSIVQATENRYSL